MQDPSEDEGCFQGLSQYPFSKRTSLPYSEPLLREHFSFPESRTRPEKPILGSKFSTVFLTRELGLLGRKAVHSRPETLPKHLDWAPGVPETKTFVSAFLELAVTSERGTDR